MTKIEIRVKLLWWENRVGESAVCAMWRGGGTWQYEEAWET